MVPVERGDAVAFEGHLFFQRHAGGVDDAAFNLVAGAVGVDHQAGVGGAPDAAEAIPEVDVELTATQA